MQANVFVVFWPLINIIQKEGQWLIIITSISNIYVLNCQSVGHKTVEELWKCGIMEGRNFGTRTKWWLSDTKVWLGLGNWVNQYSGRFAQYDDLKRNLFDSVS